MAANGAPLPRHQPGWLADRRRLLIVLAIFAASALLVGGILGWTHRSVRICRDGRPPVQQLDQGLGQVEYRCHDGQIVDR